MDEQQIIDLLKVASAYDSRKPDRMSVLAWLEASRRGRWDYQRAVDAIHQHYSLSADRIMPGHITAHMRATPLHPADRTVDEALALSPTTPVSEERRAEIVAHIRAIVGKKDIRNG